MAKFGFGKFFGNMLSSAGGTAAGGATIGVLAPVLQEEVNLSWAEFPNRPVSAESLAAGVAQGQVDPVAAKAEARLSGFSGAAFDTMVDIANVGPPLASAMDAFRRGLMSQDDFVAALNRAGIEHRWNNQLIALRHVLLDPAAIANAVQQGHLPNEGILPDPVMGDGLLDIPLTQIDLDPVELAAAHGLDLKTLQVMANLAGLPPPQGELRDMLNRGIIGEQAFQAGIREGHTKTKWVGAVRQLARRLLTPTEYVDAHLRGWISAEAMHAGTGLHGLNAADTDLLFQVHGRPLTQHEVIIGLSRGGQYDGPVDMIAPPFLKALQQSSLRPEWYNLAWAARYHLLSPFMLRTLTQAGDLTAEQTTAQLVQQGYEPDFAALVAGRWATTKAGAAKESTATDLLTLYDGKRLSRADLLADLLALGYDQADADRKADLVDARRVVSAKNTAITGLHKEYEKGSTTADNVLSALAALDVPAWAAADIVAAWTVELHGKG